MDLTHLTNTHSEEDDSWLINENPMLFALEWQESKATLKHYETAPLEVQPNSIRDYHLIPNIFDSHCHLDRIFNKRFHIKTKDFFSPEQITMNIFLNNLQAKGPLDALRKSYPKACFDSFEGCINVITSPLYFEKMYWEWMTSEPNVYLAIGCHPQDGNKYDEVAEFHLKNGT